MKIGDRLCLSFEGKKAANGGLPHKHRRTQKVMT